MAIGESYEEFVEKFKPKHTTDDCFTPPEIYETVAEWVAEEYGIERERFVRPFWPGYDFEVQTYAPTDVVVDNPPFSIITKICRWYAEKNIRFFMFAPALTIFSTVRAADVGAVCAGYSLTYENGASVNTSFVTNLEGGTIRTAPELYDRLKAADAAIRAKGKKQVHKYRFPDAVLTAAMMNYMSAHGVEWSVEKPALFIRTLDGMKPEGKTGIFGGAFLLAEKAAAEKAAAEKAAAEKAAAEKAAAIKIELSEREKALLSAAERMKRERN